MSMFIQRTIETRETSGEKGTSSHTFAEKWYKREQISDDTNYFFDSELNFAITDLQCKILNWLEANVESKIEFSIFLQWNCNLIQNQYTASIRNRKIN